MGYPIHHMGSTPADFGLGEHGASFAEILERLWTVQHTGPVVVQFHQGKPLAVELPTEPTRIVLESGK